MIARSSTSLAAAPASARASASLASRDAYLAICSGSLASPIAAAPGRLGRVSARLGALALPRAVAHLVRGARRALGLPTPMADTAEMFVGLRAELFAAWPLEADEEASEDGARAKDGLRETPRRLAVVAVASGGQGADLVGSDVGNAEPADAAVPVPAPAPAPRVLPRAA